MTPADFKLVFPEFDRAPDSLVASRLAMAEIRTPADIWGDLREQGVLYLAAQLLALAPNARPLAKGQQVGVTMYETERARLETMVTSGFRVAGLGPYGPYGYLWGYCGPLGTVDDT